MTCRKVFHINAYQTETEKEGLWLLKVLSRIERSRLDNYLLHNSNEKIKVTSK